MTKLLSTLLIFVLASCNFESAEDKSSGLFVNHQEAENKFFLTPPANNVYGTGEELIFILSHPSAITVTGTPRLTLDLGGSTVYANYDSGDGTKDLIFKYTIAPGDVDPDGIGLTNTIDLNGGTLKFPSNGSMIDATSTFNLPDLSEVTVIQTFNYITTVTAPANNTYVRDDILNFQVNLGENGFVTGTPRLALDIGGTTVFASYQSGSGSQTLNFSVTLTDGLEDLDGINITSPLDLNGGTLKNSSNFNFALGFTPPDTSLLFVDATGPTIISIAPPADNTYNQGENLDFIVTFSENATLSGSERITLTLESGAAYADYLSGSGTTNVTFRLTVNTEYDTDGILMVSLLDVNGGSVDDAYGNSSTDLSYTLPDTSNVLIVQPLPTVTIDVHPHINIANKNSYGASGTCSENGRDVTVDIGGLAVTPVPSCSAGAWSFSGFDVSSLADAASVTITADHDNVATLSAQDTKNIIKDTVAPSLTFTSNDNINGDNYLAYTLAGTCLDPDDNGGTVNIDFEGALSTTATCSSGTWNMAATDVSSVPDDTALRITIDQTDAVGNTFSTFVDVVKDSTPPQVALVNPADNSYINIATDSATFPVDGTCDENGATVNIQIDASDATSQVGFLCNGTTFSGTIDTTGLGEAAFVFTAIIADTEGNETTSTPHNVTKDITAPTVAITAALDITMANHTSYDVSGTCSSPDDDGQNIQIQLDGTINETAPCSSGTWSKTGIDVSSRPDNATFTITADLTDAAGNPAVQATTDVAKDATPPGVVITSPTDNSYINIATDSATFPISGTCDEAGETVNIQVDAVDAASQSGFLCDGANFSGTIDSTGISEGAHVFTAVLVDSVGNEGTSPDINFIKDITAPVVAITVSPDIYLGNHTSYTISGTCSSPDDDGQNIQLDFNGGELNTTAPCSGGAWSKASYDVSSSSDSTSYEITADLTDAAGNPAVQATVTIIKDTVAPLVSITNPADATYINIATNSATFSVDGTCDENGATVIIKVDGADAASQSGFVCDGANFSGTIDTTPLAEAVIAFTAELTDPTGNTGVSAANNVTKDITRPNVTGVTRADAKLHIGDNLDVGVSFDEPVNITGSVGINAVIGVGTKNIINNSGGGTASHTFRHILNDGDNDYDFDLVDFNSSTVTLNGGTIRDLAGNDAANLGFSAINANIYVFPPSIISWLDGSDNSTLYTDSGCSSTASPGQGVGCWENKYDGTNNPVQNTNSKKPILTANEVNGKQAMLFDGNNDVIEGAVNFNAQSVFIVYKAHDDAADIWGDQNGSMNLRHTKTTFIVTIRSFAFGTSSKYSKDGGNESNYTTSSSNPAWEANTYMRVFFETEDNPVALTEQTLGGNSLEGGIAEVWVFDAVLTANAKAAVHAYLQSKYGI